MIVPTATPDKPTDTCVCAVLLDDLEENRSGRQSFRRTPTCFDFSKMEIKVADHQIQPLNIVNYLKHKCRPFRRPE
jgi:hypothetical protein